MRERVNEWSRITILSANPRKCVRMFYNREDIYMDEEWRNDGGRIVNWHLLCPARTTLEPTAAEKKNQRIWHKTIMGFMLLMLLLLRQRLNEEEEQEQQRFFFRFHSLHYFWFSTLLPTYAQSLASHWAQDSTSLPLLEVILLSSAASDQLSPFRSDALMYNLSSTIHSRSVLILGPIWVSTNNKATRTNNHRDVKHE